MSSNHRVHGSTVLAAAYDGVLPAFVKEPVGVIGLGAVHPPVLAFRVAVRQANPHFFCNHVFAQLPPQVAVHFSVFDGDDDAAISCAESDSVEERQIPGYGELVADAIVHLEVLVAGQRRGAAIHRE